jgi:hypothetical protein
MEDLKAVKTREELLKQQNGILEESIVFLRDHLRDAERKTNEVMAALEKKQRQLDDAIASKIRANDLAEGVRTRVGARNDMVMTAIQSLELLQEHLDVSKKNIQKIHSSDGLFECR